jgi:light-regulated signal transduction histidine kinase (bacteriophytochrome)
VTTRAEPFVPVDLGCVVREVLDDLEVRISETGGIVERGELPTIEADPHQMRQLFQNLIGNALKYHGEKKPVVTIRGELVNGGEAWRIFVEDNGIGFDESYLERIFSPFQRLHSRAEFEGTGMGLAISRKIVERHRGGITAKSKPGEGAVFIATLPAVQRGE